MRFQRKAERLQNEPVVVCNEHPNWLQVILLVHSAQRLCA